MAERRYGRGMNWGNSFKAPRAPLLRRHGEFGQRRVPYSRDSLELRQQNNDNRSVNRNDVSHTSVSKPGCFTAEIHFSYNAKQASCSSSLSCDVAKRISVNKSYAKIRPVATNISDRGNKSSRTSKAVIDTDYDKRGRIKHQQQDRVKSEGKHSGSGRSSSIPQNIEVTNKPDDETSTAVADKPMEDDILYILADDNRFDEESDRLLGSGTVSSTSVDDVKLCSKEKECVVDDYKTNLDEPFQIHAEPADSLCGDDSNTHCPNVNNKGQSRSRDNHSDRIGDYNKPTKTKVEQVENNGKSITREMLSRSRSRMESCRLHDSGWPSKVLSRRTDANRSSRSVNDLKECKVISKRLTQFKPPFRNIHENRNNIMRRARNRFQHKDESDMYKNQACISPRRDKTYRTESKSHEDKSHFPSKSKDYNRRHFHYDQGYASNRNRGTYVPSGGDRLRQTSTQQFDEINYSSRKSEIDGTRSGTKSEKTIYITDGKTHSIDRYSQPPIQESNDHTTGDSANPAYMYTEQYNSNSYGRSFNENNSSVRSKVKHNHGFSSRMQNNDSRFTFKRHNITTSVGLRHYDRVRKKYFWGNCSKNTSRFQRPSTNKTRLMKSNNTDATSKTKTEAESKHESVREGTNCDFVSQSSPTSAVDETPQIEIPLVTHDPNEQLVFMPNLELQNSNMHIMDQFGNIVNPESVTPMGCNQPMPMQLDSSAVPIPFPGTDYVFIPFVDQVPNIPLNQGISWTNNLNEPTSNTDFISPMEQMYMMQQSMTFDMLGLQQADEGNLDKQIWCTNTGSEIDQNKSYSKTAVEKSDDCQSEEAGVNVQKYEVVGNMDDVGNTEEVKTNTNADRKHTFRKKGQPRTTKRGQYNPGQHGRHAVGTNEQNSDKRILKIKRDVEQEVSDIRKVVESSEGQFIQKKIRPIDILPTESKSINDNSTRSTSIFSRLAPGTSDKHKLLHEQRAISPLHITFQNDNYAKQEAGNKKIHINSKIQKDENPEQNMAQAHNDDISNKLFVHHKLQSADQSKNATVGNDKHTNNADQAQEREKRSVDGNKKIDSLHDKIDFVEKERQKETNVIDCHRKKSNTFIQHDQTYSKKDKGNKEVDKEYALENMRYHRQQSKYKTKEVRESANNIVGEMGKYSDGREKMDDDRTGTGNRNGRQSETYNASEMNKPRDDRVYADYNRSKTRSRDDRQHEDNSTNDMMQMDISVDDRMNRDKDRAMTVHMINGHPEHSTVNEMNTPWSHRGKRDLYETETLYRTDIPYGDNDKSPALYRDDRRYDDNFTCGIGKDGEDHWHYVKDKTMIRYRDDTEPEHTTVGGIDRQYSDNNRTGSRDRDDRKHDGNTTSKKHTDGDRKKDNDLSFTRHRDNRADRRNNSNERTGTTYTEQQLDGNNSMERIIRGEYQRNNKHERMGTMYMDDRERETDGYNSVGRNKHREDRRHKHEGIETITMEDREPESVVASERDRQHKGNSGNINDKTRTWCMDDDTSGEMDQTKYGRWNKDKYRSGIRCKDNRSRDHSGESVHDRDRHGYMRKNNDSERTRYIESSQPSTKIDSHDGKEMKSVTRMRTRYSNDRQPIDNNAGDIGTHRDGRGGTYSNKTETSYKDNTQCEHNQQDIEVRHNASERRNNDHITDQVSKSNSEMFNANDNNITKIEYNQKDIAKADKQEDGKQFDTMDYSYRRANIKMSKQVKSARIQKAEEPVQTLHGHTSQLNAVDISTALTATSQLLHKVSESNAMHIEPSLPSLNVCTLETNIAPALALQTSEGNVPPVNALQQPGCVVQQPVPGQIHHLDIGNIVSQPFQQAPVMQQLQQQILMEQAMQSQLPNQQLLNIASMNQQLQLQNLVSQMQTQDHNSGTGIQQLVVQQPNQQQKFQQFQPPQLPTTHPLLNQPTENALQQRMVQHGSIVQQQSLMDNEVLLSINQLQQVQQMLRTPSAISDQSQQAAMQPKVIGTLMARPTDGIGSGVPGLNQHRIYNSSHTGNGQNTPPSYQQTPGLIVMPNMSATVQEARGGRLVQLSSGSQQSTSNTARPSVVSGIPRSQSDVTSTAGRIGIKMGINAKSSQNKSNDDKRGILCSRCNMQFSNSKIYKKHVQWHEYYSKHFKQ